VKAGLLERRPGMEGLGRLHRDRPGVAKRIDNLLSSEGRGGE